MTTDELVDEVYLEWGESSTNSIVSPSQITALLNKAQRLLCLEGQILLSCAKTSTVAAQETYNLPSDYLKIECVFIEGRIEPLRPIDVTWRDGTSRQGTPDRYWIWGSNVNGANQYVIGLNDVPSTNGSNDLEVFYRQLPQKMVHSVDGTPVAPEAIQPWQDAMVDYALMLIYRRLGNDFKAYYDGQVALWADWKRKAAQYVNPLTNDFPLQRKDTGLYLIEDWLSP
jgi:hypothetical protein